MSVSELSLCPIQFVHHHNRYAGTLYDVDGQVLRGESGEPLNVFKEELKDMFQQKKIRFLHYMKKEPTYAYFVTSTDQLERFRDDREFGVHLPTTYHVYLD